MKKVFLLTSLVFAAVTVNAQFTLTTVDHGLIIGNSATYYKFNTIPTFMGTVWDFSTSTFDETSPITEEYSAVPSNYAAMYPGSNVMMFNSLGDTTFYRQTSGNTIDSLKIKSIKSYSTGFGSFSLDFYDPYLVLNFPFDNSMPPITENFSGTNFTGNSTTVIDSYGDLILASGTYQTIRAIHTLNLNLMIPPLPFPLPLTFKDYFWYIQNQRNPIVKIRIIDGGAALGSDTIAMANILVTGIIGKNLSDPKFTLYPNPAKDNAKINIQLDKPGTTSVEIYSNTGAKVFSQDMGMLSAGTHSLDLNTKNVAAGVYMVRIISNEETGTQRLVVE